MREIITLICFLVVLLIAVFRGGRPEKTAVMILVLALCLDPVYHLIFGYKAFAEFDLGHAIKDIAVMFVLGHVAIQANRVWPLFVAALQVLTIVAHGIAFAQVSGVRGAYWAMTELPFYLQIMVISIGLFAHISREKRLGRYPDWRFALTE